MIFLYEYCVTLEEIFTQFELISLLFLMKPNLFLLFLNLKEWNSSQVGKNFWIINQL
jgi:hypothetical protein